MGFVIDLDLYRSHPGPMFPAPQSPRQRKVRLKCRPPSRMTLAAPPLADTVSDDIESPTRIDHYSPYPVTHKGAPRTSIETDTPIVPRAIAIAVHEEASLWLET